MQLKHLRNWIIFFRWGGCVVLFYVSLNLKSTNYFSHYFKYLLMHREVKKWRDTSLLCSGCQPISPEQRDTVTWTLVGNPSQNYRRFVGIEMATIELLNIVSNNSVLDKCSARLSRNYQNCTGTLNFLTC